MTQFYDTKPEIYISTIVETNGPIPGAYSMLDIGAVAIDQDGVEISTFDIAITRLPGSREDPKTMAYWYRTEESRALIANMRERAVEPIDAISSFTSWIRNLYGRPVLTAYDSARVWMWTHWYIVSYMTKTPFTYTSLDIKTLATNFIKGGFLDFSKSDLPQNWRIEIDAPDTALIKAKKQAHILKWMLKARTELYATFDIPSLLEKNYGCSVAEAKRKQRRKAIPVAGRA